MRGPLGGFLSHNPVLRVPAGFQLNLTIGPKWPINGGEVTYEPKDSVAAFFQSSTRSPTASYRLYRVLADALRARTPSQIS
jgi:hypothetical protein